MIQARFSPRAERDLDEICDDIAADNPAAAERVRRLILNMRQYYFELASSVNWELLSPPSTPGICGPPPTPRR